MRNLPQLWPRSSLEAHDVRLDFAVAVFGGPDIECRRSHFIYLRNRQPIESEVNRFQIFPARIAGLNPNSGNSVSDISREFLVILFAAGRAENPAELPLGMAQRAEQHPLATIALGSDNRQLRQAFTIWTAIPRHFSGWPCLCFSQVFGLRLEDNTAKERSWTIGLSVRIQPPTCQLETGYRG